jgi:hypothetical protein
LLTCCFFYIKKVTQKDNSFQMPSTPSGHRPDFQKQAGVQNSPSDHPPDGQKAQTIAPLFRFFLKIQPLRQRKNAKEQKRKAFRLNKCVTACSF